jgi:hypothetical protein
MPSKSKASRKGSERSSRTARERTERPDSQVREFLRKDLGEDIRRSGAARVVRRAKGLPTSLLLEPELIAELRRRGARRGLPYQTLLKLIVRDHLHEY